MGWFEALLADLRGKYELTTEAHDSFVLELGFEGDDGEVMLQEVRGQVVGSRLGAALLVEAPVCDERGLHMHDALEHNAKLGVGSLCLVDGGYRMRAVLPAAALAGDAADDAIGLIAQEAARLRSLSAPMAIVTDIFEAYAA